MGLRPQVGDRHAPGVHEAAERPQREEQQGRWRRGAGRRAARRRSATASGSSMKRPRNHGADGLAVVVAAAEQVLADRGAHAGQDHHAEQQVGERGRRAVVVARTRGIASRAGQQQDAKPASIARPESVPAVTETTWYGPRRPRPSRSSDVGTRMPSTWPPMHREQAEVEQRALPIRSRRRSRSWVERVVQVELVVAVAPDVADDEHRQADVGQRRSTAAGRAAAHVSLSSRR